MAEQHLVFDRVADLYADVRPSYPQALVDNLVSGTGLGSDATLLEIGCGPGTATLLFAQRGYRLTCLEPGEQLCRIARARLAGFRVQVVTTTFEAWETQAETFDLVFAAQSFHWVDPTIGFAKAAAALRARGSLAIFANRPEHDDSDLDREIRGLYARHAPGLRVRAVTANTDDNFRRMFAASRRFAPASCREYRWSASYGAAEYRRLLSTQSDHLLLGERSRERLLSAIERAIDAFGGTLQVPYVTVLAYARLASGS